MADKELINLIRGLVFNTEHLVKQSIREITPEDGELYDLLPQSIPSFCYYNSYFAASTCQTGASIVYGAAVIDIGGQFLPVEHAWIKLTNDELVDPTYQNLQELRQDSFMGEVTYFKLFEIPISDFDDIADSMDLRHAKLAGIEILDLRRHPDFLHFFNRQSAPEEQLTLRSCG